MKKFLQISLPAFFLVLLIFYIFKGLGPKNYKHLNERQASENKESFDVATFASLPVLDGGRLKPWDSIARNSLLIIRGKESIRIEKNTITATEWLMDVLMNPEKADNYPIFRIDHTDVLGLFGWKQTDQKYFSIKELQEHFPKIDEQFKKVNPKSQLRNTYEKAIVKLFQSINIYHSLVHSIHSMISPGALTKEYEAFEKGIVEGVVAIDLQQKGEKFDKDAINRFMLFADHYLELSKFATILTVPIQAGKSIQEPGEWLNMGQALMERIKKDRFHPAVLLYGKLTESFRIGDAATFNASVKDLKYELKQYLPARAKIDLEYQFNKFAAFYLSKIYYIVIFVLSFLAILFRSKEMGKWIYYLLLMTALIHSVGLIVRMYIQARPPVTNLYSSAIFIGWIAVLLGVLLEKYFKNCVGAITAASVGFVTLLVAKHLEMSGDQMEMMRAVLDDNFWLATHVPTVTIGYAATYLAGFIGIVYIFMGTLSDRLNKQMSKNLYAMVYGITCFAVLFSFIGTMLGGIWADDSWGRFWGWDPKENGALLIVIWNAVMLHARWGGFAKERGIMVMAVFGNIVTTWSYFGTNMLGVGLHSYGFMDSAFFWLMVFNAVMIGIMILGSFPFEKWKSYSSIRGIKSH